MVIEQSCHGLRQLIRRDLRHKGKGIIYHYGIGIDLVVYGLLRLGKESAVGVNVRIKVILRAGIEDFRSFNTADDRAGTENVQIRNIEILSIIDDRGEILPHLTKAFYGMGKGRSALYSGGCFRPEFIINRKCGQAGQQCCQQHKYYLFHAMSSLREHILHQI